MTTITINGVEFAVDHARGEPENKRSILTIIDRTKTTHEIVLGMLLTGDDLTDLAAMLLRAARGADFERAMADADRIDLNPFTLSVPMREPDGVTVRLGDTMWRFDLDVTNERLEEIGDEMPPAQRAAVRALLRSIALGLAS